MKKIFVITGATASGKTKLSVELAKKIGAEIICADSRIVYRGLDIVSAKPSESEREGVIHHLIDIKNIEDGIYSAGDFVSDSKKIMELTEKPIIIQGGTWFYIKSLFDEKNLPHVGKNIELREKLKNLSNDELYEILKEKDIKRASLIHKNNRDKVMRSLELIEGLNGKISDFERTENKKYNEKWFMPDFSREEIYERINLRTDYMLKNGLYEEWKKNSEKYGKNEILYNTIGYREFFDYEDKAIAIEKIKQHTRNFAKRQMSWFRQNVENFGIKIIKSADEILL